MDRWTMAELKNTDDLSFAIQILYERRKGLNPYAPLYQKISETVNTLAMIRAEKERFIARISQPEAGAAPEEEITHTPPFGGSCWDIIYMDDDGQKIPARDMPDGELERIGRMVSEGYSCGEICREEAGYV